MQQQFRVDLQLPLEHQPLQRLPSEVAKFNGNSLAHFPIRRKDGAHVIFKVNQVSFQPVETIVDLLRVIKY